MLNIIYSRPSSGNNKEAQGKKTLVKFLCDNYGVSTIKKYTNQNPPTNKQDIDPNLRYVGFCQEDNFIEAIKLYDEKNGISDEAEDYKFIYTYTQVRQHDVTYIYGIKRKDIFIALQDYETHYALVCTNIKCLRDIKDDADNVQLLSRQLDGKEVFQLRSYCLVRQNKDNFTAEDSKNEANSLLNKIMQMLINRFENGSSSSDKDLQNLVDKYRTYNLASDGRPYYLPHGEDLELDFFRNVALFSNLLLIPECGNLKTEKGRNSYKESVSLIVEKYMGFEKQRKKKNVFVIHPMSEIKFTVKSQFSEPLNDVLLNEKSDENRLFKKMIYFCFGNKEIYNLTFADELKDNYTKKEGSIELTNAILKEIDCSNIIIADLRNLNHNCIHEIGYAFGRGKKVYIIWPQQQLSVVKGLLFDISTYGGGDYDLNKLISMNDVKESLKKLIDYFGIDFSRKDELLDNSELKCAFAHETKFEEFKMTYEKIISN